jgi:5-methylcytosine-specific restriction endonuclease McrA
MPARVTQERDAIAFAELVLTMLDQGAYASTYKYAVMLGLIDLCLEGTGRTGAAPEMITTRQLAEKVLCLYWPHTIPYAKGSRDHVLKQNSGRQARILTDIIEFRERLPDPSAPLHRIRREEPEAFLKLVWDIEWTLILMPLPRLQIVGQQENRFIYEIGWDTTIGGKRRAVTEYQQSGSGSFDNRILLKPGVGDYLVLLNSLLRPLIQRNWAAMITKFNRMEESVLEDFLFGSERIPLQVIRPGLMDLQNGRCFYCDREIATAEVDHFLPWARYPDDGIENLVLADSPCNRDKRDFLAATEHVLRWADRNRNDSKSAEALKEVAQYAGWETHPSETLGAARAIYFRLSEQASLWKMGKEFVVPDRRSLVEALR